MKKVRLDLLLVERGYSKSVEKAKKEILSGWVKVSGETCRNPSLKISGKEEIIVERPGGQFVSRGGDKLLHAINEFNIDMVNLVALDLGASTGGFTDCMLKSGAAKVYALDVGYNQIDYSLRIDPRVVVMEKIHARDIRKDLFQDHVDFFTADLSFISILKILPSVYSVFDKITGVILLKPQFEAEPSQHIKGIVTDPDCHKEILYRVASGIIETGFEIKGITYSPIKGHSGNIEFLLLLVRDSAGTEMPAYKDSLKNIISAVVETAHNILK